MRIFEIHVEYPTLDTAHGRRQTAVPHYKVRERVQNQASRTNRFFRRNPDAVYPETVITAAPGSLGGEGVYFRTFGDAEAEIADYMHCDGYSDPSRGVGPEVAFEVRRNSAHDDQPPGSERPTTAA